MRLAFAQPARAAEAMTWPTGRAGLLPWAGLLLS
jgi:hypothetical protein